jgi:hypothetical protein
MATAPRSAVVGEPRAPEELRPPRASKWTVDRPIHGPTERPLWPLDDGELPHLLDYYRSERYARLRPWAPMGEITDLVLLSGIGSMAVASGHAHQLRVDGIQSGAPELRWFARPYPSNDSSEWRIPIVTTELAWIVPLVAWLRKNSIAAAQLEEFCGRQSQLAFGYRWATFWDLHETFLRLAGDRLRSLSKLAELAHLTEEDARRYVRGATPDDDAGAGLGSSSLLDPFRPANAPGRVWEDPEVGFQRSRAVRAAWTNRRKDAQLERAERIVREGQALTPK